MQHSLLTLSMNLLSPSLSSAQSGGEGARRAGEEAASVHGPNSRQNLLRCSLSMNQGVAQVAHLLFRRLAVGRLLASFQRVAVFERCAGWKPAIQQSGKT